MIETVVVSAWRTDKGDGGSEDPYFTIGRDVSDDRFGAHFGQFINH